MNARSDRQGDRLGARPRLGRRRGLALAFSVAVLAGAIFSSGLPSQAADTQPQFFTSCKTSHVAQVDPIVSPGQASAHMHEFFGNRSTNADSTYESMQGGATTCTALADTAGYWVPTLTSPSGQTIRALAIKVYYRGQAGQAVRTFPPDLRMIARVSHLSSADGSNFIIEFPECWDGQNTDSADHMSHMAYSVRRVCPADHPVRVPRVTIVLRYANGVRIADNTLSSGALDTMHADFWNTWQQAGLDALVARCLNAGVKCGRITG